MKTYQATQLKAGSSHQSRLRPSNEGSTIGASTVITGDTVLVDDQTVKGGIDPGKRYSILKAGTTLTQDITLNTAAADGWYEH